MGDWRCVVVLPALLGGCALLPLQESDCKGVNWERRGYAGHPPQDLSLARQCTKYGVTVAQGDYAKGWAVGHDVHERSKVSK